MSGLSGAAILIVAANLTAAPTGSVAKPLEVVAGEQVAAVPMVVADQPASGLGVSEEQPEVDLEKGETAQKPRSHKQAKEAGEIFPVDAADHQASDLVQGATGDAVAVSDSGDDDAATADSDDAAVTADGNDDAATADGNDAAVTADSDDAAVTADGGAVTPGDTTADDDGAAAASDDDDATATNGGAIAAGATNAGGGDAAATDAATDDVTPGDDNDCGAAAISDEDAGAIAAGATKVDGGDAAATDAATDDDSATTPSDDDEDAGVIAADATKADAATDDVTPGDEVEEEDESPLVLYYECHRIMEGGIIARLCDMVQVFCFCLFI